MANPQQIQAWALPQIQALLPLPEAELKEVLSYAISLPTPDEVAQHFQVGTPPDPPSSTKPNVFPPGPP